MGVDAGKGLCVDISKNAHAVLRATEQLWRSGAKTMYVDDIATSAEVTREEVSRCHRELVRSGDWRWGKLECRPELHADSDPHKGGGKSKNVDPSQDDIEVAKYLIRMEQTYMGMRKYT